MKITDIVIEPEETITKPKRRLAKAHIVIDGILRINGIQILQNNKRMFVEFPCPPEDSAHPYIIPLNRSTRSYIEEKVISKYLSESENSLKASVILEFISKKSQKNNW